MSYFKSPAAVAEYLGVKEATVRRLAKQFTTFKRVGGQIMLTDDDVSCLVHNIRNPPMREQYLEDGSQDPFAPNVPMPHIKDV